MASTGKVAGDTVRVAVFTAKYPAKVATFFERDMRALRQAGLDIDVFSIDTLEEDLWQYSHELLDDGLPRASVHHLGIGASITRVPGSVSARALKDAATVMWSAMKFGPAPVAKTAYVMPKAWAWAAKHGHRYDHVLGYWGNYAGTCAYLFHRMMNRPEVPFTIWLHAGVDLYRTPVFMRQKLDYADNIVTCCEFNTGFIAKTFGQATADRVHVCHHGLDLREFAFRPEGRPSNVVMAVGRLAAHKGFDYLFAAAKILKDRGTEIVVDLVGDGPERKTLERLAQDLGIEAQVKYRGWLKFDGARDAMAEATVLVHPSDGLGDGLPNVIRESMALGTPVIASNVAGIPDALRDGCGVLVPPKNAEALADAIEKTLKDEAERLRMAGRARRRVEERYDLWQNGARLAALMKNSSRRTNRKALVAA
jgi:colanic acid/amylovoran biosynthesis glycosyltransferase